MRLKHMRDVLLKAKRLKYGVGQFNFFNVETAQAIVQAGVAKKSPIILGATEGAIEYCGLDNIVSIAKNWAYNTKIPIVLHLDHGKDHTLIRKCIRKGFTSVMYDGSYLEYEDNVRMTRKIVNYAHKRKVDVEAELGQLKGVEDNVRSARHVYTNPETAKDFVKRTGCNSLAIAIGTSHGAYKFKGSSKLKFDILTSIRKKLKIPLVLHGASSVYPQLVKKAETYGADLGGARGVTDASIKKAIMGGIQKVNTDTDLRIAYSGSMREFLHTKSSVFDPRKIAAPGIDSMLDVVSHKIDVLGSAGRG